MVNRKKLNLELKPKVRECQSSLEGYLFSLAAYFVVDFALKIFKQ